MIASVEKISNGYLVRWSDYVHAVRDMPQALAKVAEVFGDIKVGEHVNPPYLEVQEDADKVRNYKERWP